MLDDDLDLDLEIESQPNKRGKPRELARPTPPGPEAAPPASEPAATEQPSEVPRKAEVVPAKKASLLARLLAPIAEFLSRIPPPRWSARNFLIGLLLLVLVALVWDNWPPMRLSLVVWHVDVPRSVVLLVDFALGFLVAWLFLRRRGVPQLPAQPEG